jgi:hypothetical protein
MDILVYRTEYNPQSSVYGYRNMEGKSCRISTFTPAALAEFAAGEFLYHRLSSDSFEHHVRFLETVDVSHLPQFADHPLTEAERTDFLAHLQ